MASTSASQPAVPSSELRARPVAVAFAFMRLTNRRNKMAMATTMTALPTWPQKTALVKAKVEQTKLKETLLNKSRKIK